jgi:exodeoxyribonuclease-3
MRIATWNVNSIRARVERVVDYIVREEIDVLCMQEIKCRDNQFPYEQFTAAGYEVVLHGEPVERWPLPHAFPRRRAITFPSQPGFGEPDADGNAP